MDHARSSRPFLELDVFEENAIGRGFYDAYGVTVVGAHDDEATGRRLVRLRLD